MRRCGSASAIPTGFYEAHGLKGFFLSADFCAEHEIGVKRLWDLFGISPPIKEAPELHDYKATEVPKLLYQEKKRGRKKIDSAVLAVKDYYSDGEEPFNHIVDYEIELYGEQTIAAAWTESSFAIHVVGEEAIGQLRLLKEAIENKRVAIFLGGPSQNPFSRLGLSITIIPGGE